MSEPLRTVNVGLIGLGTVGGGVARLIKSHHDEYLAAYGIDLKLTRACALAWEQAEAAGIEREAFTSDWHDVVTDPAVDIVVELIGGEHPATEIFTTAFENGKHVVSANKALLGRHVETLAEKARACGVQIKCEASCGGGIPIVSTLEHDLVGNKILTIAGILNGTTNYILTRMIKAGLTFEQALKEAQENGYAERDPSADVDGHDACRKICILAALAFGQHVYPDQVPTQGIRGVTLADVAYADSCGYKIKLLGRAIREGEGKLCAFVAPHLVPASNPLSGVEDVFNAISVTGNAIGDVMFYGRGAGKLPTASAVVADVIDIAKDLKTARCAVWGPGSRDLVVSSDILSSRWYVRGTASMDKVRAAFGEISPLARGGAPAGETAFLTAPMTEPQVRARLEGMELHSLIRVLE